MQTLRTVRKHHAQHWKTRNDSTNVAQALNPHQVLNESCRRCRRHFSPRINQAQLKEYQGKTCYCQRSPVRSKFNFKPKASPADKSAKSCQVRCASPCRRKGAGDCNERTRLAIPSYRIEELDNAQAKNLRRESPKLAYEAETEQESEGEKQTPFQNKDIEKNLKELNTFRKENYFDCHSTQNLNDKLSAHKCLHKFVLNDRLMPQPLNPDPFGTSRCMHCNRPIDAEPQPLTKEKGNYQSSVLKKKNPYVHSISVTKNKGVTEIEIPTNFQKFVELLDNSGNLKQIKPSNSIALRHQKGVQLE